MLRLKEGVRDCLLHVILICLFFACAEHFYDFGPWRADLEAIVGSSYLFPSCSSGSSSVSSSIYFYIFLSSDSSKAKTSFPSNVLDVAQFYEN